MVDSISITLPFSRNSTNDIPLHHEPFDINKRILPDNCTQEIQLIDMNISKTWMAFVSKYHHEPDLYSITDSTMDGTRYFLTISQFKGSITNVQRYSYDISEAYDQNIPRTCMFLSISQDGTRVAISFAQVDGMGFVENNPLFIPNPECLIFKTETDKSVLYLDKKIKFQGRAVFSKNNDLMLINKKVLEIYNNDYRKTRWFDLKMFGVNNNLQSREAISALEYTLKPQWAWISRDHFHDLKRTEIKDIIAMSRLIHLDILITPYRTRAHVWSLIDKGVRLTSISKKPDEEIMAFSNDFRFLATFVDSTREVNVYNVKSGLFSYKLTLQHQMPDERRFEISYIRFCLKERYLVMIGLERDMHDDLHKAVDYEVWHMESRQSIYSKNIDTQLSIHNDHKTFTPFVMICSRDSSSSPISQTHRQPSIENLDIVSISIVRPFDTDNPLNPSNDDSEEETLKQNIYALYVEYDRRGRNTLTCMKSIDIYSSTTDGTIDLDNEVLPEWKMATSDLLDLSGVYDAISDSIQKKSSVCFIRYYRDRVYLLQFGQRLVQLWRLPTTTNIAVIGEEKNTVLDISGIYDLGELLFIHAYNAPYYGFTCNFRETWSVKEKENSQEKCYKFMRHTNSDGIDRIIVVLTMDPSEEHSMDFSKNNINDFLRAELFIPFKEMVMPNSTFSENSLHLHLKSSCQALHYLYKTKHSMEIAKSPAIELVMDVTTLFETTQKIIAECVERIADIPTKYKYFCTISGSNILAMLASFKEGQKIIFQLLQIAKLRFSLFSYPKKLTKEEEKENLSTNENALTVLIEYASYDLYKLLFNRILFDSKVVGIGSLSVFTDVLIYLQEISNTDLLVSSGQKLSYLTVDTKTIATLGEEAIYILQKKMFKKNYTTSFRMMQSFYFSEQITEYKNSLFCHIKYQWSIFWRNKPSPWKTIKRWSRTVSYALKWNLVIKFLRKRRQSPRKAAVLCVVPLPRFLLYSNFPEDRRNNEGLSYHQSYSTNIIPNKLVSVFIKTATNQSESSIFRQSDTVLEVLLQYKWNTLIRTYFILTYTIYIAFYVSYSIGVSFPKEVFGYEPGSAVSSDGHRACIVITVLSAFVLIAQEFIQFWKSYDKVIYAKSFYNWVDWSAYCLSIVTFLLLRTGNTNLEKVNAFTTFVLWMHAISKLRIVKIVCITIEMIVQLIVDVGGFLLILILVVCAFTNGVMVLLSHKEDSYFQEQFQGTVNYTGFNESESPNMSLFDSSTSNNFGNVFYSFSNMWFLLFGVWDPVTSGEAGDDKVLRVIAIIFSLLVAWIFFNIFIAYMNSTIEDVKKRGARAYVSHFAEVIAELEELWCRKSVKYMRKYNPAYLYYIANEDAVVEQEVNLHEETWELSKRLKAIYSIDMDEAKLPVYDSTIRDLQDTLKSHFEALKTLPLPESVRQLIHQEWDQKDLYLNKKIESLKNFKRSVGLAE